MMKKFLRPSEAKFLSGFLTNLAAGWFGVIAITPNFSDLSQREDLLLLTRNAILVTVCSVLAIKIEESMRP